MYIYIYGQASGVPSPPPPPKGMVWYGVGGGGWRVRRGVGAVGAAAVHKPYASHKSYNVEQ